MIVRDVVAGYSENETKYKSTAREKAEALGIKATGLFII
jgi:hypothetical protein